MLAYTALSLPAIMAGNLLSVAVLWMMIDLVSFLYLVARVEDESGAQLLVGRLAIDMSGRLALAAAAASFAGTLELPSAGPARCSRQRFFPWLSSYGWDFSRCTSRPRRCRKSVGVWGP